MLEQIISFITPGSLTDKFEFRTRVFTSWISLGLLLGLIMGLATVNSGVATPNGPIVLILQYTIGFPIIICLLGLIGLGLNSMRGGDAEYAGWYWWLFPIVTYLVIGFWFTIGIIGVGLALTGVNLPKTSFRQQSSSKIDPEKFRREVENLKVEDFLKKFHEQLEQLEQLEQQSKLEPEQAKVVRKLRTFDRSKYDSRMRDIFDEDDRRKLILLLLIFFGVEVKVR